MRSKKGFTIIEVLVVFLLILGVTFLILPRSLNTTKHARFISQWTQTYSEVEYMFSAIKAQQEDELRKKLDNANDNDNRKDIIIETVKPYLRITTQAPLSYHQHYMNGEAVAFNGRYHFKNFYLTSSKQVVGLKWIREKCQEHEICAIMAFDVNGIEPPNTWGEDVFGVNILKNSIEPTGKGIEPEILRADCSSKGFGTYCSYYYLIGGKFE